MRKFFHIFILFVCVAGCSKPSFEKGVARAEEYVGLGNFKKAARVYENLLKNYPSDPKVVFVMLNLGDIYADMEGNIEKGLKVYQSVIELNPYSEAARLSHEKRALLFEKTAYPSGMTEEYAALLKYFPNHANALEYRVKLGESYIMSREYQQARTELRGFIEQKNVPDELRQIALFDIGETYFLEGKSGKAVRFYNAFLEEAPKSELAGEVKLRIATCLEEMGYLGAAKKYVEDAGKDYPDKKAIEQRLSDIEKRSKPPERK